MQLCRDWNFANPFVGEVGDLYSGNHACPHISHSAAMVYFFINLTKRLSLPHRSIPWLPQELATVHPIIVRMQLKTRTSQGSLGKLWRVDQTSPLSVSSNLQEQLATVWESCEESIRHLHSVLSNLQESNNDAITRSTGQAGGKDLASVGFETVPLPIQHELPDHFP